jgi:hypothetical protein
VLWNAGALTSSKLSVGNGRSKMGGGFSLHGMSRLMRSAGFGLHTPPQQPATAVSHATTTGLIWLLRGRRVIALTETTAAIQGATSILTYRKLNKPALGPLGDSLDDMGPAT